MADGGIGFYQKLKAKYLASIWKKCADPKLFRSRDIDDIRYKLIFQDGR